MERFWSYLTLVIPAFLVAFGAAETYAGVTGKQFYTQWIREKLGIQPARPRHTWAAPLFAFVLGGFAIWFIPHIEWGFW